MRAFCPGQIVNQLIRRNLTAVVDWGRGVKWIPNVRKRERRITVGLRVWIVKAEGEFVSADNKLVSDIARGRPAIVDSQVLGVAERVNKVRQAIWRRFASAITGIAKGILAALRIATVDGTSRRYVVVNLGNEVVLSFMLRGGKAKSGGVQSISGC